MEHMKIFETKQKQFKPVYYDDAFLTSWSTFVSLWSAFFPFPLCCENQSCPVLNLIVSIQKHLFACFCDGAIDSFGISFYCSSQKVNFVLAWSKTSKQLSRKPWSQQHCFIDRLVNYIRIVNKFRQRFLFTSNAVHQTKMNMGNLHSKNLYKASEANQFTCNFNKEFICFSKKVAHTHSQSNYNEVFFLSVVSWRKT